MKTEQIYNNRQDENNTMMTQQSSLSQRLCPGEQQP
jgi:hypothetical protein